MSFIASPEYRVADALGGLEMAVWLRTEARPVRTKQDWEDARWLADALRETQQSLGWLASSSTNLYVEGWPAPLQVILVKSGKDLVALANPRRWDYGAKTRLGGEGCGSLGRGLFGVERYTRELVAGIDVDTGRPRLMRPESTLHAHEIDHLEGKLICDDGVLIGITGGQDYTENLNSLIVSATVKNSLESYGTKLYWKIASLELRLVYDGGEPAWIAHRSSCVRPRFQERYGYSINARLPDNERIRVSLREDYQRLREEQVRGPGYPNFFGPELRWCDCLGGSAIRR